MATNGNDIERLRKELFKAQRDGDDDRYNSLLKRLREAELNKRVKVRWNNKTYLAPYGEIYPLDYYAGSNAAIYLGSQWIDDIVSIQFTGTQAKAPIYGYNSTTWDGVARGTFVVQGSFSIAFREVGYLYNIWQKAKNKDGKEKLMDFFEKAWENNTTDTMQVRTDGKNNDAPYIDLTAEVLKKRIESYKDQIMDSNVLDNIDVCEKYLMNKYWGNGNTEGKNYLPRPDEFDKDANTKGNNFDILITYGQVGEPGSRSTVKALVDVRILSFGQVIQPTSDFIQEQYTFIARDMDGRATKHLSSNESGCNKGGENK